MTLQDLLPFCRYYRGETDIDKHGSHHLFKCYEKLWCDSVLSGDPEDKDYLEDITASFHKDFPFKAFASDNVPDSLAALLYNRYLHWCLTPDDDADDAKENFINGYFANYLRGGSLQDAPPADTLHSDADNCLLKTHVAGFSFGDGNKVLHLIRPGRKLRIIREPGNRYDPNAVALYLSNSKLGYIPKSFNIPIARLIDAGTPLSATVSEFSVSIDDDRDKEIIVKIFRINSAE